MDSLLGQQNTKKILEEEEEKEQMDNANSSDDDLRSGGTPETEHDVTESPPQRRTRRHLPARELHTAMSVMDFMQELHEEDDAGKTEQPPQYKDYLKAQRQLKHARQQRRSSFGLMEEEDQGRNGNRVSRRNLAILGAASNRNLVGSSPTLGATSLRNLNTRPSSRRAAAGHQRPSLRNLTGVSSRQGLSPEEEDKGARHRRRSLQAMRALSTRHGSTGGDWQAFLDQDVEAQLDDDDRIDEDTLDHHDQHPTVPWYCRPVQRQRWDDDQVLPHVNWGDLFFDLFYVSAAYNLGSMLISAMGEDSGDWPRGVVYFVGIFGPLYNIWENDVVYSSRYTLVDYSHRIVAVARFLCLSFAVMSIKPLSFLGDKNSAETFTLTTSLFFESIMQLGLNLELYFWGEGDRTAIQNHTYRKIVYQFVPASLTYLVAAIVAGVSFFSASEEGGYDSVYKYGYGYDQSTSTGVANYGYNNTSSSTGYGDQYNAIIGDDDHHVGSEENDSGLLGRLLGAAAASSSRCGGGHRGLASAGGSYYDDDASYYDDCSGGKSGGVQWTIADVPLMLCLAIYLLNIAHNLFQKLTSAKFREYTGKEHKDIREQYVPNNIDYMIHRYGEWIMLMIGESVLSLLIVETSESSAYYAIAGMGCLTVIVLQMLKFESEPSHADGHALWRSKLAALLFSLLIQILSMGLIAFGVSYKIMLKKIILDEQLDEETGHRQLGPAAPIITDKAVASLFCGALAIALLSLEMMLGTHKGVTKGYQLLFHEIESFHLSSLNWPLMLISLFKFVLIFFTATLSQWATDPTVVTVFGFFIVTSMAITRIVGWGYVNHEEEIKEALRSVADKSIDVARTTGSIAFKTGSFARKTITAGLMDWSERSEMSALIDISERSDTWDASADCIVVTEKVGQINYVNKAVLAQFGYESEAELVGNNVSVLVGGGEADCHHLYMKHFNKSGKMSTTIGKERKVQARRRDGSEFSCFIAIKGLPGTEFLIGTIRPLQRPLPHERSSQVCQGKETNQDYHLDETSPDSIVVVDAKGSIVDLNATALKEFGFASKEEIIADNISRLIDETEDSAITIAAFDEGHQGSHNQHAVKFRRKNGTEFPCLLEIQKTTAGDKLFCFLRNEAGTAQKTEKAQDSVIREKTKCQVDGTSLDSITAPYVEGNMMLLDPVEHLVDDNSFDAIMVTDFTGKILRVNKMALCEFRYQSKDEMIGKKVSDLVHSIAETQLHGKFIPVGQERMVMSRRGDGSEFRCTMRVNKIEDTKENLLIGYIRNLEVTDETV